MSNLFTTLDVQIAMTKLNQSHGNFHINGVKVSCSIRNFNGGNHNGEKFHTGYVNPSDLVNTFDVL